MYLLASDESKLVISNYKVLRNNVSGLSLEIKVDRTATTFDEVETYFNNIIDNKLKLEVYNDAEEKEQSLSGFSLELYIGVKGTLLDVTLKCDSENAYQIGLLQDKTAKQETVLNEQSDAINQHANVINNQGTALATHEQQITGLNQSSGVQMSTLEAIILSVIPTAIADAVTGLTDNFNTMLEELKETLSITELPEESFDEEYYEDTTYNEVVEDTETSEEEVVEETDTEESDSETPAEETVAE